jgi:hypothetical protein
MAIPWYRNFFRSAPKTKTGLQATMAKAATGDADAQFSVALQYANREGAAQDYVQAAHWYLKAAEQSHSLAQFNLGLMYAKGQGVPRNEVLALVWFEKAARLGDAGAQHHLGMRRHRASLGENLKDAPESKVEAFKWFHLAAAQGYKGSEAACERVTMTMTREQVAEGEQRAASFLAVAE